ncbi:MAG: hypothetical protein LBP59_03210 [Planctomycetaceae bacterium]|nr:hypothetical protein [Planctomycetaceae bacterium]
MRDKWDNFCYKNSSKGSRASRLHFRIAGVPPASGCTQPPMREVTSQPIFLFTLRQIADETVAFLFDFL